MRAIHSQLHLEFSPLYRRLCRMGPSMWANGKVIWGMALASRQELSEWKGRVAQSEARYIKTRSGILAWSKPEIRCGNLWTPELTHIKLEPRSFFLSARSIFRYINLILILSYFFLFCKWMLHKPGECCVVLQAINGGFGAHTGREGESRDAKVAEIPASFPCIPLQSFADLAGWCLLRRNICREQGTCRRRAF